MRLFKLFTFGIFSLASVFRSAAQTPYNTQVSRILGQAVLQRSNLTATGANLCEGREFYSPQAVALDTTVSPPSLYVADTGNNRVLAWKNAATFATGAFADLVLGQQDVYSTGAAGPAITLNQALGFYSPVGVTVDSHGNLYVVDAGNNRILRFPKPFSQPPGKINPPDLVIGQTSLNSYLPNQGVSTPAANTLALTTNNGPLLSTAVFDGQGSLWVSDSGNNRVLRYPSTVLGSQPSNGPNADLVLGQTTFTTNALAPNSTPLSKNVIFGPSYLAFDPSGRLYVSDAGLRVLVFPAPQFTAEPATRIMGIVVPTKDNPNPPTVSASTLGLGNIPPGGIFFVGSNPWVVDTPNSRILGYAPFDQWAPEATAFSPPAIAVLGQADFASGKVNQGNPRPSHTSLAAPNGVAFAGSDLYVADAANNRVLDFPLTGSTFGAATRVLGQTDFIYNSVNLIEGREFDFFTFTRNLNGGNFAEPGGGVAIDTHSNPPHLYVADAGNHRILGYKDIRQAKAGAPADLVIGQPDFKTSEINYPNNDGTKPNASSLYFPSAVTVAPNGDLWVADTFNGRVLRFPSPYTQTGTGMQTANVVVGQLNFTQTLAAATAQTMGLPVGIAFTKSGGLLVSDAGFNRVLYFAKTAGGDFTIGESATSVIGQITFTSKDPNDIAVGSGGLSAPHGIAVDDNDSLYVADTGNNRVAIFAAIASAISGPTPAVTIGNLNNPSGVVVNPVTQEVWVSDAFNNRLLRYLNYDQLLQGNLNATVTIPVSLPDALSLDGNGNPVTVEAGANRVGFYYPVMYPSNSANYFGAYAPGMIASLFPATGAKFGTGKPASATTVPIPTTVGDLQVFVNGVASPIFYASPTQINFQVPIKTPAAAGQQVTVVQASTNLVLADSFVGMSLSAPGLYTADSSGSNQISAINADDNTPNSGTHPVKAGHIISLFGTGQGFLAGAPPDGQPSGKAVSTSANPQVFAGGPNFIASGDVLYSGLAPCCVGLWQINFKVPANAAPGPVIVFVDFQGHNSANGPSPQNPQLGLRVVTTIYVKQ